MTSDENTSWNELTRALRADPSKLDALAPRLAADIAQTPTFGQGALRYVDLWGESSNVDASQAGAPHPKPSVDEAILDALHARAGMPGARHGAVTFAGIEHTYGYLLSDLETPFGFKRARWVRDDVEMGFGLPRGVLGPTPPGGTLFGNVTFFAGKIAFRGGSDAAEARAVESGRSSVSPALRAFDFDALAATRIEETVDLGARTVTFRTDYVAFTRRSPAPDGNTDVLVYSIRDGERARLISMFAVAPASKAKATDRSRMGDAQMIAPQFNAVVEGFTGPKSGARKLRPPQGTPIF